MLWLGLALLVVVLSVWATVLLLAQPVWMALAFTALAVLVFTGVLVYRKLRASARAAALERELMRQASAQADQVRPDRRPEILALQAQMKSAIESLKRTKVGSRGGRSALYALPWYVIVGPPAAGKTTALAQSGLAFVAPGGGSASKVRGTAGTRNCDWWFSAEAILLDTAGRLATEEDDRDEWLAFLGIVKRFRGDRPLDGIVVAVSVEDLLSATEVRVEELAKELRSRVDELMSQLEMVLPVYVMFTKTDLLGGFVEFFGDFSKVQRGQAWGATFELDDERLDEPAAAIHGEFDLLVQVLHARMLERLAREPLPEVRARILQFPVEFQALRTPIAQFLEEICRSNPYQETPLLRGFYFSSGTQTGRALDRVLSNMARGFDLRFGNHDAHSQPAQSYFVTELFQKIIFPDRHLAVRSNSRVRRRARRQALQAGGAVLVSLAIVAPAASSYADNLDLVDATQRDIEETARLERGASAAAAASALDRLLDRLQHLEREKSRFQVRGLLGPHTAPELHAALSRAYLQRLRAMVSGPVRTQIVADVRAAGDLVRTDPENFQSAYQDLKLYLMLTKPEHLQVDWASAQLSQTWARAIRGNGESDDRLRTHARYYVEALAADHAWRWETDASIVARAQGRLAFQPIEELRYSWLVDSAKGAPPIRPETIFFGASSMYWTARDNVEVAGLYTALGWEKVRALLESPDARLELEPWVLGKAGTERGGTEKSSAARLRDLYFQRYVSAWSDFLAGLDVKAPTDMRMALEELRALSEADGPYIRLFRTLSDNVTLELKDASLLDSVIEKGKVAAAKVVDKLDGKDAGAPERTVSSVERHFRPLLRFAFGDATPGKGEAPPSGLSQYLAHLTTLEVSLSQLAESKSEATVEFETELSRTAGAVQRLLGGLEPRTRMTLEPLLMNPIRGSRAGVVRADFAALSERWKAEVWESWNTKLASRYPFSDVPSEATLAEFAEFFRPQTGTIWKFYTQSLEGRLERNGSEFSIKASADPLPFRGDFLRCLNFAQEITDAVFGAAPEPNVPLGLKIQSVGSNISEVSLLIDGQAIVYRNEPERWMATQWPGKGTPRGGTLRVKGAGFTDEIPRAGDFGLFRLLAAGSIKPSGALAEGVPVFVATWSLTRPGEPPVTIELRPAKSSHPLSRDFFRRLKCPPAVTDATAAAAPGALPR